MKRIFTLMIAIISISALITSCEKGSSISDPVVPPGKDITHPDSTIIEVTIATGTATTLKLVGDFASTNNWQPLTLSSCVVFDNVGNNTFRKQVANSFFAKDEFECKLLRGANWGAGNEEVFATGNRKIKKADLKGKVLRLSVTQWN
jgi:hypothetical protein